MSIIRCIGMMSMGSISGTGQFNKFPNPQIRSPSLNFRGRGWG